MRDWNDILSVLKNIRELAVPLFRCSREEIQVRVHTRRISNEDVVIADIWHVVEKVEHCLDVGSNSSRYFEEGPYSGMGDTVGEALCNLSYVVRLRVEETIQKLTDALAHLATVTELDEVSFGKTCPAGGSEHDIRSSNS